MRLIHQKCIFDIKTLWAGLLAICAAVPFTATAHAADTNSHPYAELEKVVFTAKNAKNICKNNLVDKDELAQEIIRAHSWYSFTNLPFQIIQSKEDLSLLIASPKDFLEQPASGASPNGNTRANLVTNRTELISAFDAFGASFTNYILNEWPTDKRYYKLKYRPDIASNRSSSLEDLIVQTRRARLRDPDLSGALKKDLLTFFQSGDAPLYVIECTDGEKSNIASTRERIAADILLRNEASALAVTGDEFKKAKPAAIAFANDAEKGERKFDVKGALGLKVNGLPSFEGKSNDEKEKILNIRKLAEPLHIVFLGFDFSSVDNDANENEKDVRQLTPGYQWARTFGADPDDLGTDSFCAPFCLRLNSEIAHTFDLAHNAKVLKARLRASPTALKLGRSYLFNKDELINVPFMTPILWRPTATAILEAGHVFEAGTNMDFQTLEDDEYVGIGGEVGLKLSTSFGFDDKDKFSVTTSYRYLDIVSGMLGNPSRFQTEFAYKFSENVSLIISYQEGQNVETFQDEELTKIGLGVKY